MEFSESSEISVDNIQIVSLRGYKFLNELVHQLAYFSFANPFQDTFHYISKTSKHKRKEECISSDCLYLVQTVWVVSFTVRLYRDKNLHFVILQYSLHDIRISCGILATSIPISYIKEWDRHERTVQFLSSDRNKLPGIADLSKAPCSTTSCCNAGIKILALQSNTGTYNYL